MSLKTAFESKGVTVVLAVGVGVLVLWYLKKKAGEVATAINPLNHDNVFSQGTHAIVDSVGGQGTTDTVFDSIFGVIDLFNPFNESDAYAADALGLVDVTSWNKNIDLESVNPLNNKNVFYEGVNSAVGEGNVATIGDYFFGALDLINPFNKSDDYADKVYGIGDDDYRTIANNNKEGIH